MKACSGCGQTKALDQFHRRAASQDGRTGQCKPCRVEYNRQRYTADRRRILDRQRARRYGLTDDELAALHASQGGACAVCRGTAPGGNGTWHVDHAHETGRVRGLLCSGCNVGLGHFRDDVTLLRSAIEYLGGLP